MTVSVGVASLTEGTTALDVFVSAADNALYRAKTAGRNRVELHSFCIGLRSNLDVRTQVSREPIRCLETDTTAPEKRRRIGRM